MTKAFPEISDTNCLRFLEVSIGRTAEESEDEALFDELAEVGEFFGVVVPPPPPPPPTLEPAQVDEPLSLPWRSLRIAPLDAESLLLLADSVAAPKTNLLDDPVEARLDRRVASEAPRPGEQRNVLLELYRRYPAETTRTQLKKLLDRGVSPSELRKVARVRVRSTGVFLEFNRLHLFGFSYAGGSSESCTWHQAWQLYQAGIRSRVQIYQYFDRLVTRYAQSRHLQREFKSVLNLASHVLQFGDDRALVDSGPCRELSTRLSFAAHGVGQVWRWQDARYTTCSPRLGLPARANLATVTPDQCSNPRSPLRPYPRGFGPIFLAESDAKERLLLALLQESPLTLAYLRGFLIGYEDISQRDWRLKSLLLELEESGKLVRRLRDLWYYRETQDIPRKIPRISTKPDGPEFSTASLFDLGLGYLRLRQAFPEVGEEQLKRDFLQLWKLPISKGNLGALNRELQLFEHEYAAEVRSFESYSKR